MVSSPSGRRGSSLLGRAHHQGGWGRLSDDRPGQHNPDSSEDPWGGGLPTLHGGASARNRPDTERDIRGYDEMHEGRKQTNTWSVYAGSRLELSDALGRRRPKQPSFQPYWGKPAVRNDRGDRGDVGIIRSPVRASILPDCGGRPVMGVPTAIDATALVPYLASLGVSHIYASPIMESRPGSTHGYDIDDHNRLNPEIGTEAD